MTARLSLLAVALIWAGDTMGATFNVQAQNFFFGPSNTTIKVNDTIHWVNPNAGFHSVVSSSTAFGPSALPFDIFEFTFTSPGTYNYHCGIHGGPNSGMNGNIIVTNAVAGPSVSISSPAANAVLVAPVNLVVEAATAGSDPIVRVDFYVGAGLIGTDTTPPYGATNLNLALGAHLLTAIVTDTKGLSATSAPVNITVASAPNMAPVVAIIQPLGGAIFSTRSNVLIHADATDDGTVTNVQFYSGTDLLSAVSTPPYQISLSNMMVKVHSLTAVATDNFGTRATSAPVVIQVLAPEAVKPTVTVLTPIQNARVTNPFVVVTGKAGDNVAVAAVLAQLNDSPLFTILSGTSNWSGGFALVPGTNMLRFKARDLLGNESIPVLRNIYLVVTNPVSIANTGQGAIAGLTNGQIVEVGKGYKLTAAARAGNLFSNWSGAISSTNPVLNFIMPSNAAFTANFVTNPFLPARGLYTGLLGQSNSIAFTNSGLISLTLGGSGAFSGKVLLAGGNHVFNGQFLVDGSASVRIPRPGRPALNGRLSLDLAGKESLSGTVSDGVFTVPVRADKAVFSTPANPAPFAGKYTLNFPGTNEVAGDGIGTLTVSPAGTVLLNGALADGTVVGQSVPVSRGGWWPMYVPLYAGKGMVMSWVQLSTNDVRSVEGNVVWTKNPVPGKYYADGFVVMTTVDGGQYLAPPAGATNRPLALTNATVVLSGGNLTAGITNSIVLTNNNVLRITGTNGLTLTIAASSGLVSGSFIHPQSRAVTPIKAVLRQDQTNLHGFFLGTSLSGRIFLQP